MRVNILDPGLIFSGGHHLEYDIRIAEELIRRGHEARVYSHARISDSARESVAAIAPAIPLFRPSPYSNPAKVDPISGELRIFLDGALMLAEDLGRVEAADLWIWPTLFAPQLHACALANPRVDIAGCIHVEPNYMASNGRMWWRYALEKCRKAGLRTNLGVTIPRLGREYSLLAGDERVSMWPILADGAPIKVPRTGLRRIGFFGHQRAEKGTAILATLISRLLGDGFEVVLHDSGDLSRIDQAPGLVTLGFVPSLAEEIARCDLVVLPYDPAAYRARGSSVGCEAIASGIPVIAPAGTPIGFLVESTGAGALFAALTAEEIHRVVLAARDGYRRFSNAAFEASRAWPERHGIKNFVSKMLGDLRPQPSA